MSWQKTAPSSSVSLWMGLRVSPPPASALAVAGHRDLSRLASRMLWRSSSRVSGFPQIPAPVNASQCILELPRFLHLPAAPTVNLRVASNLRSVCVAYWPISGFPRLPALRLYQLTHFGSRPEIRPPALPPMRLQVSPAPASAAGSMMNPNFTRTLHPSAEPEDESSCPIRRP